MPEKNFKINKLDLKEMLDISQDLLNLSSGLRLQQETLLATVKRLYQLIAKIEEKENGSNS